MPPDETQPSSGSNQQQQPEPTNEATTNSFVLGKHTTIKPMAPIIDSSDSQTETEATPSIVTNDNGPQPAQLEVKSIPQVSNNIVASEPPSTPLNPPTARLTIQPSSDFINNINNELNSTPDSKDSSEESKPSSVPNDPSSSNATTESLPITQDTNPDPQPIPRPLQPETTPAPQVYGPAVAISSTPIDSAEEQAPTGAVAFNQDNKQKKVSFSLKHLIAAVVLLFIIGAAVGGYLYWQNYENSPAVVFRDALVNSLMQTKMKQTISGQGTKVTTLLDDSNVNNPVVYNQMTLNVFGLTIGLDGYGNPQTGLEEITKSYLPAKYNNSYLNLWTTIKTHGKYLANIDSLSTYVTDPYQSIFGQWITGNFNQTQRAQLVNYAIANNIYNYQSKDVTATIVNGQKSLNYHIKINNNKLLQLNLKAARMLNLNKAEIANIKNNINLSSTKNIDMYINLNPKQIVKVKYSGAISSQGSDTVTYQFGDYIVLPQQPKQQIEYSKLETILSNGLSSSANKGTLTPSSPSK